MNMLKKSQPVYIFSLVHSSMIAREEQSRNLRLSQTGSKSFLPAFSPCMRARVSQPCYKIVTTRVHIIVLPTERERARKRERDEWKRKHDVERYGVCGLTSGSASLRDVHVIYASRRHGPCHGGVT